MVRSSSRRPTTIAADPKEVEVNVADPENACSKGVDLNFQLSAFVVSGRVVSGDSLGPTQLGLGLYSADGRKVAETHTDKQGFYSFSAAPGKYVISTLDQTAQCVEKGSVPVEVVQGPVAVEEHINIAGHSLFVHINSASGTPMSKTTVTLFSDVAIPVSF